LTGPNKRVDRRPRSKHRLIESARLASPVTRGVRRSQSSALFCNYIIQVFSDSNIWKGESLHMSEAIYSEFTDNIKTAFYEGDTKVDTKVEEAENVRQVQEVFRALIRKDFAGLGDLLAEDVTLEIIGSPATPLAGHTRGRQQVLEATRNNLEVVKEQRPEVEAVIAQGNAVVVVGKEQGRFRATGLEYILHWIYIYRFKDGKIISVRELLDSAALVEAMQPNQR
jgi:ketosteroid isomerase-like protein